VTSVSAISRLISEASAEQSRGVQQVNKTVTEMDKVVQQNASAVQASNAAAESMRQQAGLLLQAVGAFRIAREAQDVDNGGERAPALTRASALRAPPAGAGAVRTEVARRAPPEDDQWEQF
jgi:hypothetical protein